MATTNWWTRGSPEYDYALQQAAATDAEGKPLYGYTPAQDFNAIKGGDWLTNLGWTGPTNLQGDAYGGEQPGYSVGAIDPALLSFLASKGYSQGHDGTTLNAVLGPDGSEVQGSGWDANTHDAGGMNFALAALGGAGLAAGGAFGSAAAGAGAGSSSIADTVAMMQANGMSAAEIAAATGGAVPGFTAADIAAMSAAAPYGASAGSGLATYSANLAPLEQVAPLGATPGAMSVPSIGSLANLGPALGAGIGAAAATSLIPGIADSSLLKGGALLAGAALGGTKSAGPTTTEQKSIDPRLDPYIYGDNGILANAANLYQQNKSGVNPTMQAGWDKQLSLLNDPTVASQLTQMRNNSMGLLGGSVASNPFTTGQAQLGGGLLNMPQRKTTMPVRGGGF